MLFDYLCVLHQQLMFYYDFSCQNRQAPTLMFAVKMTSTDKKINSAIDYHEYLVQFDADINVGAW